MRGAFPRPVSFRLPIGSRKEETQTINSRTAKQQDHGAITGHKDPIDVEEKFILKREQA